MLRLEKLMSFNASTPGINPRLTASFGIFTSAFASLVLMLIILEQLGLDRRWINQLIIVLPLLFYAGIGLMVRTNNIDDYYVSGQRVPPFYAGFALSANLVGGAGLIGVTGAFFFMGFDALPIVLGWCAGLGLMSALFAPYLRKTGAFSLPGFFGIRFSSRLVRLVAALIIFPSLMLLLAAELRAGQMIATVFLPGHPKLLLQLGLVLLVITIVFGGMRSLTWTQCVQFIVVVLGIGTPLVAVAILLTNLPLPQLSYGGVFREMALLEGARGLVPQGAQAISNALPTTGTEALTQPFTEMFASIGRGGFFALTLCVMLGTAVLPAQVARASTTANVSGVRLAFGWAAVFVGFMVLTIPAYAAFLKFQVLKQLLGVPMAQIPEWGRMLSQLGLISLSGSQLDPALGSAKVLFHRDTVLLLLPAINNFPLVLIGLVGAGAIAAALAAAAGQLVAAANVFSNDIFYSLVSRTASPARRLLVARLSMIGFAILGFWIASKSWTDPLRMLLWAFSLCAGSFFGPLVMSIWWRGITSFGAILGMLLGFAATGAYIMATAGGGYPWFGVDGLTAAILGVPLSVAGAFAGSLISSKPDAQALSLVDEMHVPSGETIYSRLGRLAARHKAPKP